jgi:hypothetical protein
MENIGLPLPGTDSFMPLQSSCRTISRADTVLVFTEKEVHVLTSQKKGERNVSSMGAGARQTSRSSIAQLRSRLAPCTGTTRRRGPSRQLAQPRHFSCATAYYHMQPFCTSCAPRCPGALPTHTHPPLRRCPPPTAANLLQPLKDACQSSAGASLVIHVKAKGDDGGTAMGAMLDAAKEQVGLRARGAPQTMGRGGARQSAAQVQGRQRAAALARRWRQGPGRGRCGDSVFRSRPVQAMLRLSGARIPS